MMLARGKRFVKDYAITKEKVGVLEHKVQQLDEANIRHG
jgi:hypothetical protein